MIQCPQCDDEKLGKRCRTCRRNEYYRKQGHYVWSPCGQCLVRTKLYRNGWCGRCLKKAGLKECASCLEPLGIDLSFSGRHASCRSCQDQPQADSCGCGECRTCLKRSGLCRCRKCKAVKIKAQDFYPGHATCKTCVITYNTEKQKHRARATNSKAVTRRAQLKHKYSLAESDYENMLVAQRGACGICNKKPPADAVLCVDHDHKTGKVRGLLCRGHNSALGLFSDSPELLVKAAEYLRRAVYESPTQAKAQEVEEPEEA